MQWTRHGRSLQTLIIITQHFAARVVHSAMVLRVLAWLASLEQCPWVHRVRNAIARTFAFVVGSTFVDEQLAFSKLRLVKNDAYRDRLLESEIADLVDLCDALRMTLPQRKALFRCFLHLDFMRRSTLSRLELLRYCNLRACPLTAFLLPLPTAATHRPAAAKRWDISQLFAACFSICTVDQGLVRSRGIWCRVSLVRAQLLNSLRQLPACVSCHLGGSDSEQAATAAARADS
jgi:hypothetical protein